MIRYPGKAIRFSRNNGMEEYLPEPADIFLPETDMEIAMKMISLRFGETELIVFDPGILILDKKVQIPVLPDEVEIPEVDR